MLESGSDRSKGALWPVSAFVAVELSCSTGVVVAGVPASITR